MFIIQNILTDVERCNNDNDCLEIEYCGGDSGNGGYCYDYRNGCKYYHNAIVVNHYC